ncbi:MAG: glutathione transferase GstA [Byssovorax sp.]
MKLYFSPGACSLSPHIVLREAGFDFEIERVDFATKKTTRGTDYTTINPNGYVPALVLDSGDVLTEGPAIVQYLADQKPESGLAPKNGTIERAHLQEWLNFISTELHKAYSPLFSAKTPEEHKATVRETLSKRLDYVAHKLDGKAFLMGDHFTVADAYLFTVISWGKYTGLPLDRWPVLAAYHARIKDRQTVKDAMAAEKAASK